MATQAPTIEPEEDGNNIDDLGDGAFDKLFINQPTTKYRESTLGKLLMETLTDLSGQNKVSETLRDKILCTFDRCILYQLNQRIKSRLTFKASKLNTYRCMDNTWTFILDEVEFRQYTSFANVPKLKILAFHGKVPHPHQLTEGGTKKRGKKCDNIAAATVTPSDLFDN